MKENKFRYSKCPYCSKHGIDIFSKSGKATTYKTRCIYCNKLFKANVWVSAIMNITIGIGLGISVLLFSKYICRIPTIVLILLVLVAYYFKEYFLPVRKIDD